MNQFEKLGFALAKSAEKQAFGGPGGGFGGGQGGQGGRKVSPAAIKYTGPGVHGEGRSGPTRKSPTMMRGFRIHDPFPGGDVRGPGVNLDRSPNLPSGIDQVNRSAAKGPEIRSLPASSTATIGSALRNADNRQMHGTLYLAGHMWGPTARKALADSAMKQPGSRWVGFNGPRARQASTELMSDLQAGRRLPQVRNSSNPFRGSSAHDDQVRLYTGPEEYRQLGMNPTQILMHEIRHTRQPEQLSNAEYHKLTEVERQNYLAAREIPPSTGDLVNAGEIYKRTTGKPLQHTVNFPSGKSHDINWMIDQAKQHGYLDGSKSMTELMATPEGQQWLRSLILHNEGPGLNKRSADQTENGGPSWLGLGLGGGAGAGTGAGLSEMNQFEKLGFALAKSADNNRWLNDFDRNRYIFGSGIKRWLNQPGGFFGPPVPTPLGPQFMQRTLPASPAGSKWIARHTGLSTGDGFAKFDTHLRPWGRLTSEEHATVPYTLPSSTSFRFIRRASPTRTPSPIGRWLGATQGLSTPATAERIEKMQKAERIEKMQKPVPPVIRYSDPSLWDAVAPRPRSPAPVPATAKRINKLGLD